MNNKKSHLNGMIYTWKHKKAFLEIEKSLLGKNSLRAYLHDLDKLVWWYPLAFVLKKDSKWVQNKHRSHCRHHVDNNIPKKREDYIEMIIDWECARFSKPDKPLNAFQTMRKFYPELEEQIVPLLKELKLID